MAKNTEKEFELEVPFNTLKDLKLARKKFKKEVLNREDNGSCWEFYLQYLDDSYVADDLKPNRNSRDLNLMILKYGEEEGRIRCEKILEHDKFKNTLDGFISRYGKEDGTQRYKNKNSRLSVSIKSLKENGYSEDEIENIRSKHGKNSARTMDNYIKQYGEIQGIKKYEEMTHNRRSHWQVKYWIEKNFTEDEAKKIISGLQCRDDNHFIKKYGQKLGVEKYKEFNKKRISATRGTTVSKIEKQVFSQILEIHPDAKCSFPIDKYVVDIFVPSKNIIIEVYGDYWHCNPSMWLSDEYNKNLHMTAKQKWEKDEERIVKLQNLGYKAIIVWESSIKKGNFCLKEVLQ